jgi:hypothetical protein
MNDTKHPGLERLPNLRFVIAKPRPPTLRVFSTNKVAPKHEEAHA